MKKLFVFQENKNKYLQELKYAYDKCDGALRIPYSKLTVDYLLQHEVDVVVSNGLPKEMYYCFRGMNIVSITIDKREDYLTIADIVIDCYSNEVQKQFCGERFSVSRNGNFDFEEVANLMQKLDWDSDFFGFPVAFMSSKNLTDIIIKRSNRFVMDNGIRLIEYLCNCHDNTSVLVAERNGFHFTDIRLRFEKKLEKQVNVPLKAPFSFNKACHEDIPLLRNIANNLYMDSRYFFDGNFDTNKINDFYKDWVEKAVYGTYDNVCFCIYYSGEPIAFCTVKYASPYSADIGVVGVSDKFQGQKIGQQLLQMVCNQLIKDNYSMLYVVTQGRNYAAQRTYQGAGFKTFSTELWYHKWV